MGSQFHVYHLCSHCIHFSPVCFHGSWTPCEKRIIGWVLLSIHRIIISMVHITVPTSLWVIPTSLSIVVAVEIIMVLVLRLLVCISLLVIVVISWDISVIHFCWMCISA